MFLYIILFIVFVIFFLNVLNKRSFVKLFERGNTIVSGMRGCGKDMAYCVVVNSRKENYISNVNYSDPKKKYKCFPLDLKVWDLKNEYKDLVSGDVKPYFYPYPDGLDYYVSDAGIYFPAQFATELAKKYKSETMFQALSRHLGESNVHCNVQQQSRLWDKIREQSDIYIVMKRCFVLGKFCRLTAYVYDLAVSAEKQIELPSFGIGKSGRDRRLQFEISHGRIKKISFWTRIPYQYDSRRFKKILESGADWGDYV